MAILLPNTEYNLNMVIKFQCRHIDANGFLFKAMEVTPDTKVVPCVLKTTPKGPDQVSICDELGVRICRKSKKKKKYISSVFLLITFKHWINYL